MTRPVTVPVRPDPAGRTGPRPHVAQRSWRRTGHGFYVPAWVDPTPVDQRVVEAAAMLPDDWGGITGWAALAWGGATWFDGTAWGGGRVRPVTLAVGGNRAIRAQARIATSEERLSPAELTVVDGVRVTVPVRSVCFEMRYARDVRDAVIMLDMACFNDLVSIDEVDDFCENLHGWTGMPQLRAARALADENAWSPREVGMRLDWELEARLPRPLCNVPVFDRGGRLLGVPDLIDPRAGVIGEYNGALHLEGRQYGKDVDREGAFRGHGLEVVTMHAGDVRDPSEFVRRLREAYDRASDIPAHRRLWTLEQPAWWRDTSTVPARRALDDYWRSRLLAHRVA